MEKYIGTLPVNDNMFMALTALFVSLGAFCSVL